MRHCWDAFYHSNVVSDEPGVMGGLCSLLTASIQHHSAKDIFTREELHRLDLSLKREKMERIAGYNSTASQLSWHI